MRPGDWITSYVEENHGVEACRFGGCYDLVDALLVDFPTAERWELVEGYEPHGLPLKSDFEAVKKHPRWCEAPLEEWLGGFGAHCVAVIDDIPYDAAGAGTFEALTELYSWIRNPVWVRTE